MGREQVCEQPLEWENWFLESVTKFVSIDLWAVWYWSCQISLNVSKNDVCQKDFHQHIWPITTYISRACHLCHLANGFLPDIQSLSGISTVEATQKWNWIKAHPGARGALSLQNRSCPEDEHTAHVGPCSGQTWLKNASVQHACCHLRTSRHDPGLLIKTKGTQPLIGHVVVLCVWQHNSFVIWVVRQHGWGEQHVAF